MLRVMTYAVSYTRFGIELVLCNLYVTRFDLTKGLSFDTFFVAVFYKLCRCDH